MIFIIYMGAVALVGLMLILLVTLASLSAWYASRGLDLITESELSPLVRLELLGDWTSQYVSHARFKWLKEAIKKYEAEDKR
jgi:transposase InsO family protein